MRRILRQYHSSQSYFHLIKVKFIPPRDMTSISTGEIQNIFVKLDQQVEKDDKILEIVTDKTNIEEQAIARGVVKKIYVQLDQKIKKGDILYAIECQ